MTGFQEQLKECLVQHNDLEAKFNDTWTKYLISEHYLGQCRAALIGGCKECSIIQDGQVEFSDNREKQNNVGRGVQFSNITEARHNVALIR